MAFTVTQSISTWPNRGSAVVKEIKLSCTANTNGSVDTDDGTGSHGKTLTEEMLGWLLDEVVCDPGSTSPTANSDFTITDKFGIDILDGNGTDLIQATATKKTVPQTDGVYKQYPVTGNLQLTVTNNAVANATFDIYFILVNSSTS